MAEQLSREQFRSAVSDAVRGVLNVYREVDAMLRELSMALASEDPQFAPLFKRVVPGVKGNPDARYLRQYHGAIFAPADASSADEDDDEEDDGGEEDEEENATTSKKPLVIRTGSGLVVARAAVYTPGGSDFEPNLLVAILTGCRIPADVPLGTQLGVSRQRLRRIVRTVESARDNVGKAVETGVTAYVVGQPKTKKHKLTFDLPRAVQEHALFEVTPERLSEIAAKVREDWVASTSG